MLALEPGAASGAESRADRRRGGLAPADNARKDSEEEASGEPGGLGMEPGRRIAACDSGPLKQSGKGGAHPIAALRPRFGVRPRPQWMRGCRPELQPRDPAAALGRMRAVRPSAVRRRRRIRPAAGLACLGDGAVRARAGPP